MSRLHSERIIALAHVRRTSLSQPYIPETLKIHEIEHGRRAKGRMPVVIGFLQSRSKIAIDQFEKLWFIELPSERIDQISSPIWTPL